MTTSGLQLGDVLHFSRFILSFQDIIRAIDLPRGSRENDVEHSYELAMMGWYLNNKAELGYDNARIVEYALTHDLVEAYVGDVPVFGANGHDGKEERELGAIQRFQVDFPDAQDIARIMLSYMQRQDDEATFIYALDKLMPMINIYLDNGRTWRQDGIHLEKMKEVQAPKIALSGPVFEVYRQLIVVLDQNQFLFAA